MSSTLFILAAFVVLSWTQTFTCNVDQETNPQRVNGGFVKAVVKYSWPAKSIKTIYTTTQFTNLLSYNNAGGYGATNPYSGQYDIEYGPNCPCSTSALSAPMSPFWNDATKLRATTRDGVSGFEPISVDDEMDFIVFGGDGFPTKINWDDGTKWTLTGCQTSTFSASEFNSPDGCTCDKPMDVVLVLDRSSSINADEFVLEKNFVQALVAGFTCSPTGVNLGMTNFHAYTWDGPVNLPQGNSNANVAAGADALQCAPFPQCVVANSPGSCCGSGTSISAGIVNGADMLATASNAPFRAGASKVMIVLTDGYHNKILKRDTNQADQIDRSVNGKPSGIPFIVNGAACQETAGGACQAGLDADLDFAIAYAVNKIPRLTIIAVGVGDTWNQRQLERVAQGKPENVLGTRDWNQLIQLVDDLVARTCDQTADAGCQNCCGLCTCGGTCVPVDGCAPTNFCDVATVIGSCCTITQKPASACPPGANKCLDYFCNPAANNGAGGCDSSPKPIPQPVNPCLKTTCVPETGVFETTNICPPPPPPPKCVRDADCNDNLMCTTDTCVVDPANDQNNDCKFTPVVCTDTTCTTQVCNPATGTCAVTPKPVPANKTCYTYACVEGTGIVPTLVDACPPTPPCTVDGDCDDGNACTNEVCTVDAVEPLLNKCTYTPVDIVATCTAANKCNLARCDPAVGCAYDAVPVPPNTTCFQYHCDLQTGEVVSSPNLCPPPPPPPACVTTADCDDSSMCTTEVCVQPNTTEAKCVYTQVTCNDNNFCTTDTCAPATGCVYTNRTGDFCNDNNACTTDTCDPLSTNETWPCKNVNVTCPANPDVCHEYVCDKEDGCILLDIKCSRTRSGSGRGRNNTDNCTVSGCNITRNQGCYVKSAGTCGAPPVALIAGITAGVVAGIVIAAVAGALIVGGGAAYAFTQGAGAGLGASIANNPIYTPAGSAGNNPFHK